MEKRKIHVILTLIILILATKCGLQDGVEPVSTREFTTAFKDEGLASIKNSMKISNSNGRLNSTIFDRVNWNKVYKVFNSETQLTTYTMPLIADTPNQFDNLIVVENAEEQHAYIMRYIPSLDWIKNKPRRGGFESFTGIIEIVDTNGTVETYTEYRNGKPISQKKKTVAESLNVLR